MIADEPDEPVTFQPLGVYELPAMPAVHALRRFATMLLQRMQRTEAGDPVLSNERLQSASSKQVERMVAPPAHGPLLSELDRSLADWHTDPSPPSWIKLVVLPPGDRTALLRDWAERRGGRLLEPPARAALLAGGTVDPGALQGAGTLVVPDLAHWFLRHRNGLQTVRALLLLLSRHEGHCLIGCNSWAWAYLCHAVGADLLLPPGITFQAFDAKRLQRWFSSLAADSEGETATFRLAGNGVDVLASEGGRKFDDNYLKRLAARSFGIPWVAWHLWRASLRSRLEGNGLSDKASASIEKATEGDARTVWVAGFDELKLPHKHEEASLLVLQALLIHGELSAAELRAVLPFVGDVDLLPALMRASYVQRSGDGFHILPAAYPQAREALAAGGFPLDRL